MTGKPCTLDKVEKAFGYVPNLLRVAEHDLALMTDLFERLDFAYLNSPLPWRFREVVFTYLSRFCTVPYCLGRHAAHLLGVGSQLGPSDESFTVEEVLRLVKEPTPTHSLITAHLSRLGKKSPVEGEWPSESESHLLACAVAVYLRLADLSDVKAALDRYLGKTLTGRLIALVLCVAFVHRWTEAHPEITPDDDVQQLIDRERGVRDWLATYNNVVQHEMREPAQLRSPHIASSLAHINIADMLSSRELQTFELIGRGCGTREVAEAMRVGVKTVETFKGRIKAKLGLASTTDLVKEATLWLVRRR